MLGHLLRHNSLLANIFEEQINGHKGKERLRNVFIEGIVKLAECKSIHRCKKKLNGME